MDENGKRDDLEAANNAVKPDTTVLQDLLAALGIKAKKQAAPTPDKNQEINKLDTMQADKTNLATDLAHKSSHKNLESIKERSEGNPKEHIIANDDTGKIEDAGPDENAKDSASLTSSRR